VYAKFRCTPVHIKKALGIFRELIPTTTRTTTRVAFWYHRGHLASANNMFQSGDILATKLVENEELAVKQKTRINVN